MSKHSGIIQKIIKELLRNKKKVEKFVYFLKNYQTILKTIKSLNITNVHPYLYKKWSFGVAFFIGKYKNEKVFIKVDTKIHQLENELHVREKLQNTLHEYLIDMYEFYSNEDIQIAIFPFFANMAELHGESIVKNPDYVKEIVYILTTLHEHGIIHRDIKLDNFLLVDDTLKIIDFVFACSLNGSATLKELDSNRKDHLEILKLLGPYRPASYIKNFEWNDFISMKFIIEEIVKHSNVPLQCRKALEQYAVIFDELSIGKTYCYRK